jgi:hypothetical protein
MSALEDAVHYALAHETPWPRDLRAHLEAGFFEPPPHNEILGPIRQRGGPNGLILRSGSVLARWGDTQQVDFTFSVAKSYLSLLAGIAVGDGLIRELDEPVALTVTDGGFEGHTTALSPGGTCCSRRRSGKGRCSASPTSSIAIGTSQSKGRGGRATRVHCGCRVRSGNTTMCG